MDLQVLRAAGINTEELLSRLMGSEALLERLLGKFLADDGLDRLVAASRADDPAEGLAAAHAIKGMSGNLSMTRIFDITSRQCELIRADDWEGAKALVPELVDAYDEVSSAIRAAR